MLKSIRELDWEKWTKETESNIAQYKGVPGVWMLLGRKKTGGALACLQVGKTKDIGREIEADISYLNAEDSIEPVKKCYVNQFGEAQFEYMEYPAVRIRTLYKEIAKNYENLLFVCAAHGSELEDDELCKMIEKYIAYRTQCLYWVNGGSYKVGRSGEEVKSIKEAYQKECSRLFENIKKYDFPKGWERLGKFLDDLIDEKITCQFSV